VLAVIVFHSIAGKWSPARLPAATASVETVSPPDHHFTTSCGFTGAGAVRRLALSALPGGETRPAALFHFVIAKRTLWMVALSLLSEVAVLGHYFAVGAVAFFGYGVHACGGYPAVIEIEQGADGDYVEDGFVAPSRGAHAFGVHL
jgi:hypothetical protein